jgi:putative flippase GtrA
MIGRHLARAPRFTLVAIVCALIHNLVLIGMDALGAGVLLCQTASAAILLPVGYLLQSRFTFEVERSFGGFLRYSLALITNFPIALLVLWLTRNMAGMPMLIAAPLSSIVLFCWNYMTSSWALVPAPPLSKEQPING